MKVIYNGKVISEKGVASTDSLPEEIEDFVNYPTLADFPEVGFSGRIYFNDEESLPYLWNATQNKYVPFRVDNDGGEF